MSSEAISLGPNIRKELPFLLFILNNADEKQSRTFLARHINSSQHKALREIALNATSKDRSRINFSSKSVEVDNLIKSNKTRIQKLIAGKLDDDKLVHLYPFLKRCIFYMLKTYGYSTKINPTSLK